MKGDLWVTDDYLRDLKAPEYVAKAVDELFPLGSCYQFILDWCAVNGRLVLGERLMDAIGATDDVRTYSKDIDEPQSLILFAGTIKAKGKIHAMYIHTGKDLEADGNIESECNICAGGNIFTKRTIKTPFDIEAGGDVYAWYGIYAGECVRVGGKIVTEGYGIFAGLNIQPSCWEEGAVVTAAEKPENLISGYFEEKEVKE